MMHPHAVPFHLALKVADVDTVVYKKATQRAAALKEKYMLDDEIKWIDPDEVGVSEWNRGHKQKPNMPYVIENLCPNIAQDGLDPELFKPGCLVSIKDILEIKFELKILKIKLDSKKTIGC
jgi:hypothetical protein